MDIVDYCKKKNSIFTGDNSGTGYTFSDKLLKMRETDYNVGLNQKKIVITIESDLNRKADLYYLRPMGKCFLTSFKNILTVKKQGLPYRPKGSFLSYGGYSLL